MLLFLNIRLKCFWKIIVLMVVKKALLVKKNGFLDLKFCT